MFYSDDIERDFDRQDRERERRLARFPVCENKRCGKRIMEDDYYEIDGEILCEDCMKERYRKYTEDYIQID